MHGLAHEYRGENAAKPRLEIERAPGAGKLEELNILLCPREPRHPRRTVIPEDHSMSSRIGYLPMRRKILPTENQDRASHAVRRR